MDATLTKDLSSQLKKLNLAGLYKTEHLINSPQNSNVIIDTDNSVINFCSNNYLGLANNSRLIQAAQKALHQYGYGLASVRFICGTQTVHRNLELTIAKFLKKEDSIVLASCFDANAAIFECLLNNEDAVISDALNHASIIDGIRLCKATRMRYQHNDMHDLEQKLITSKNMRYRLIVTDGIFSMDGVAANLTKICSLAEKYNAIVVVDDSHATGFMGKNGRGTVEYFGVEDKVDIYTGTLGKALGGASGGYIAGKKPIIDWLKQKARPYLFSNALAPMIAATSIEVFNILDSEGNNLRKTLWDNVKYFKSELIYLGFKLNPEFNHPILPIMLYDAKLSKQMADLLLKEGIYVISFSFPVVPQEQARIRLQVSAAHTREQLDKTLTAFAKIGKKLGVIN